MTVAQAGTVATGRIAGRRFMAAIAGPGAKYAWVENSPRPPRRRAREMARAETDADDAPNGRTHQASKITRMVSHA